MITDVPLPSNFEREGLGFIHLGTDHVFELYWHMARAELEGMDWTDEADQFWLAARQPLAISLTLVHLGIELLVKGRIAGISPYLLIAGGPREWPRGCASRNTAFAEFRIVDSQELIRLHDTVCSERLPKNLVDKHEELRRRRNTIMHTVPKDLAIAPKEVILAGLDAVRQLIADKSWFFSRREYLESNAVSAAHSPDHVPDQMLLEAARLFALLSDREFKLHFGSSKRQRRYRCEYCVRWSDLDDVPGTAVLHPNAPMSQELRCLMCDRIYRVQRTPCLEASCAGNVRSMRGVCLTCGTKQGP